MQQWKLILAYDGAPYHGWQVQPGLRTVQGTLAEAIHQVTGEAVLPQGSGRTDTGVHALGQVASFALDVPIPPPNLLRALNRALPPAIRVMSAEQAPPDFHARHAARWKTYEYRIFPRVPADRAEPDLICPPPVAPYSWDCPWRIDMELANHAAAQVVGEHDFLSFAASDPDLATRQGGGVKSSVRRIVQSGWTTAGDLLIYRVTGSGFLHHMVRNLVGTFVEIASRRAQADAVQTILAARDRAAAGPTAPARGLFLVSVEYLAHQPEVA